MGPGPEESKTLMRQRMEQAVFAWGDVRPKHVFGNPGYLRGGRMFAFLTGDGVGVGSLSAEEQAELTERDGVSVFEYNGMPMKQWLVLPLRDEADLAAALPWIQRAYEGAVRK